MTQSYGIIDLFAGPGGLGEGFSRFSSAGHHPFEIVLSAEKERSAHATLRLRAWMRQRIREDGRFPKACLPLLHGEAREPGAEITESTLWQEVGRETRRLELGTETAAEVVNAAIDEAHRRNDDSVLIGGPPCQAYSLVGRSRNMGIKGYRAEQDHRHFLFKEYLRVLDRLKPAVFVMENVKGMLSAKVEGASIFGRILDDLHAVGGYVPLALSVDGDDLFGTWSTDPRSFIVRAENHGVPQARHRVILVGVREDVARRLGGSDSIPRLERRPGVPLAAVLDGMPPLRSRLSKGGDSGSAWRDAMRTVAEFVGGLAEAEVDGPIDRLAREIDQFAHAVRRRNEVPPSSSTASAGFGADCPQELRDWLGSGGLDATAGHEARGHMTSDLARYFFASIHAKALGRSPVMEDFPRALWPDHTNWTSGKFKDRFRVQLHDQPSTTVTSHISKDGHYFIHPDPMQCRSLTVREAARLQTFPDDYLFMGNRTEQYVQVGNAVPPFLARHIASVVHRILQAGTAAYGQQATAQAG